MALSLGAAALIGGSTLLGAFMGSQASSKAASTQAGAAQQATQAQLEMFREAQESVAPWRQAGVWSLNQLIGTPTAEPATPWTPWEPYLEETPLTPVDEQGNALVQPTQPTQPATPTPPSAEVQKHIDMLNRMPEEGRTIHTPGGVDLIPGRDEMIQRWLSLPEGTPHREAAMRISGQWQEPATPAQQPATPTATPAQQPAPINALASAIPAQLSAIPTQPTLSNALVSATNALGSAAPAQPATPTETSTQQPGFEGGLLVQGPGEFEASPDYQFIKGEAINALDRSAASRGRLRSGAHEKELMILGKNLASTEYDKWLNWYYQSLNPFLSLAGMGQISAGNIGNQALSTGAGLARNALYSGDARASGYINRANVLSGALSSGINNYLLLNALG